MKTNLRYRGRLGQIGLYLGKFMRIFVYQNDWKVCLSPRRGQQQEPLRWYVYVSGPVSSIPFRSSAGRGM